MIWNFQIWTQLKNKQELHRLTEIQKFCPLRFNSSWKLHPGCSDSKQPGISPWRRCSQWHRAVKYSAGHYSSMFTPLLLGIFTVWCQLTIQLTFSPEARPPPLMKVTTRDQVQGHWPTWPFDLPPAMKSASQGPCPKEGHKMTDRNQQAMTNGAQTAFLNSLSKCASIIPWRGRCINVYRRC